LRVVPTHHEALEEGMELIKITLDKAIEKIMDGEISCAPTISGILLIDRMVKEGKL